MSIPVRFVVMMVALLFMVVPNLLAQREDTPISPPDPVYSNMWPAARAQTADSANGVVAVVWGTTEVSEEQDSLYAAFYVQLIRNGSAVGSPKLVGGPGARPASNIRVVPFGGNFLVFYNDYLAERSMVQFLDGRTGSLGNPYPWSSGQYTINYERRNIMVMGKGDFWRIFWYCPYMVTATFDSLGKPLTSPVRLADTLPVDMLSYPWFPEIMVIPDKMSRSYPNTGIYSRSNGRLLPGMPSLQGPFHIGRDSSLLVLNDSTLYFRESILDTNQQVQKRALELSQWMVGSGNGLVWRDDGGRISLYFSTGVSGNYSANRRAFVRVLRLRMDSFSAPIVADTFLVDSLASHDSYTAHTGYFRVQGNSNNSQVCIKFTYDDIYITLDSTGALKRLFGQIPPVPIPPSTEITPVRREREGLSAVEIRLRDTVEVSLPIATVPHRYPAVTAFPGSIICTWRGIDTSFRDVQARWDLRSNTMKDSSTYQPPPRVELKGIVRNAKREVYDRAGAFPGNAGLAYNYICTGISIVLIGNRDPWEYGGPAAASRYAFARPGESGWRELGKIIEDGGPAGYSPNIKWIGTIIGYDPDYSTIILLLRKDQRSVFTKYFLYSYSHTQEAWMLDSLPVTGKDGFVPMGVKGYIAISGNKGTVVREGNITQSFDIPSDSLLNVRYHKIFGPRFARTSWDAGDTTRFRMEIFDTLGTRLHTAAIPLPSKTDDYMLMPLRADSSFVILFGGDRGVRGIVLKQDLALVVADTLLSATTGRVSRPAGAVRGDTLFLVWEDYRDAVSRIYGTYHSGSWLPSSVDEDVAPINEIADDAAFIYPNPAGDAMTITAYSRNGDGIPYDMSDVLGREILRGRMGEGESGEVNATVDISAVPPGAYIVRLWNNGRARAQMVIKR